MGHPALFVVAGLDLQRVVELLPEGLELLFPGAGRGQLQRRSQLQKLGLVLLIKQYRLMDRVVYHEVLFRKAGAEMPPQQRQDIVFGVDDRTQHPVVLLEADEALKLSTSQSRLFFIS